MSCLNYYRKFPDDLEQIIRFEIRELKEDWPGVIDDLEKLHMIQVTILRERIRKLEKAIEAHGIILLGDDE